MSTPPTLITIKYLLFYVGLVVAAIASIHHAVSITTHASTSNNSDSNNNIIIDNDVSHTSIDSSSEHIPIPPNKTNENIFPFILQSSSRQFRNLRVPARLKDLRFGQPAHSGTKIPYNIIFTHEENILKTKKPRLAYKNIIKTIGFYTQAFKEQAPANVDPKIRVIFMDDPKCRWVITAVAPLLLWHFKHEGYGPTRGDICRIAALYYFGGYYFDVDIEVVEPVVPLPAHVDFTTVYQPIRRDFFQAFIASKSRHPILKKAFDYMHETYEGKHKLDLLGTKTLKWAFHGVENAEIVHKGVKFLEEIWLEHDESQRMYPGFPLQEGEGCCCNYAVHDPKAKKIYFYSRLPGYSTRCYLKDGMESNEDKLQN